MEVHSDDIKVKLEFDDTEYKEDRDDDRKFELILTDQEKHCGDKILNISQEENLQDPLEINCCKVEIKEEVLEY